MIATIDFLGLGQNLFLVLVGVLSAWNAWRQKKMGTTMDTVHELVNSRMGSELLIGMMSAKSLAKLDPSQSNIELANAAAEKYAEHQRKQSLVDSKTVNH